MDVTLYDSIRAALTGRKARSAWSKGVLLYAFDLVDEVEQRAEYEKRNPDTVTECKEWALNGAADWSMYSYGGCSLIYDGDIAERLCTPSEYKRKRGGDLDPNSRETWLDVQARALFQAARIVCGIYREILKEGV